MKNSFKFGFLALAMMVAFASCGGASQTKTEDAAAEEVSTEVDITAETLENVADSTAVPAEESLEDVQ